MFSHVGRSQKKSVPSLATTSVLQFSPSDCGFARDGGVNPRLFPVALNVTYVSLLLGQCCPCCAFGWHPRSIFAFRGRLGGSHPRIFPSGDSSSSPIFGKACDNPLPSMGSGRQVAATSYAS